LRSFTRLGASMSVIDFAQVGSSLSIRPFARFGSQFALLGVGRFASSLAVLDIAHLGSTMSLRSCSRFGATLSLMDLIHVGSSLAMRSFCRLGASFSVLGVCFGSSMAVLDFVDFGGSISLRALTRLASSVSVLDFAHLGAAMALRNFARVGSALSLFGVSRLASTLSVLDYAHIGSSLSLRSYARLGSTLRVFDSVHFASTVSIRKDFKVGGSLSIGETKKMPAVNYYLEYTSKDGGTLDYVYKNIKSLSMNYMGGTLHGMWNMDYDGSGMFQYSDRRLKENIRPLYKTLAAASAGGPDTRKVPDKPDDKADRDIGEQPHWSDVLQRLRPVSYDLRSDPGKERFGFIADEMGQVLPQVTRTQANQESRMGIIYEDLIAVLINAMQDLFSDMAQLRPRVNSVEHRIQERKAWRLKRRRTLGPAR